MERIDGRQAGQLRPVTFSLDYIAYPEGSVLVSMGETRVLCNVSIEAGAPRWMQAQNLPGGWVTAEYAMLPRATHTRSRRENRGPSGRSQEIQRLIGRSLRAGVELEKLGPRTFIVDCDVLQADGGTRTAAITGGYLALRMALRTLIGSEVLDESVLKPAIAAVSVGVVEGQPLLDLNYAEDSQAQADMNIVMNAAGQFIEVQGTAEGRPFERATLNQLLDLANDGILHLLELQNQALA